MTGTDRWHGGVPTDHLLPAQPRQLAAREHWHKFHDPGIAYDAGVAKAAQAMMFVNTIAIVGAQVSATNNTSLVLTKSVTNGNTLLVQFGGTGSTAPTIATTAGSTSAWTLDASTGGTAPRGAIWRATATATGSITATVTAGTAINQATLTEWTNISGVDTVGTAGSGTGGTAAPTSISPVVGNCLYVATFADNSGTNTFASTNFTRLGATGFAGVGCYSVLAGQPATQGTATFSGGSPNWRAMGVTYAPTIPASGWTYVSASSASTALSGTSGSVTVTPATNALIYVTVAVTTSVALPTITDNSSGGAAWNTAPNGIQNASGTMQTFWKQANAADFNGGSGITITAHYATIITGVLEADVFTCPAGTTVVLDADGSTSFSGATTANWSDSSGSSYPTFGDALAIASTLKGATTSAPTGANTFGGGASGSNPAVPLSVALAAQDTRLQVMQGANAQGNTTAANNVWTSTWTSSSSGVAIGATFVYVWTQSVSDSAATADSITTGRGFARPISDSAVTADSIARMVVEGRSIADSAVTTDAVTAQGVRPRAITEVAFTADSITRTVVEARPVAEAAITTDSVSASGTSARSASDTALTVDSVLAAIVLSVSASDAAITMDTATSAGAFARTINDAAATSDSVVISGSFSTSASDAAVTVDAVTTAFMATTSASDTALTGDTLTQGVVLHKTASDTALTVDAVFTGPVRFFFETVFTLDTVTTAMVVARSVSDTALTGDSVATARTRSVSVGDVAFTLDSVTASSALGAAVSDSALTADSVSAIAKTSVAETAFTFDTVAIVLRQPRQLIWRFSSSLDRWRISGALARWKITKAVDDALTRR